MTNGAALSADGEAAWLRLRQHLEWCDCFALVFLFSDQPAVARVLRDRLAAVYRARVTGLEVPLPATAEELLQGLLPRLLHPPAYVRALKAPVWLDLARLPADGTAPRRAAWRQARLELLARLNEQRETLRRALSQPLILVLPLAEKAAIRALVPDLWALRLFSLDLGRWLAAPTEPAAPVRTEVAPQPFPLDETEQSLVREWRRVRDRGQADRGALLAGGRAFDALLGRGRLDEAHEVAAWLAASARARLAGNADDPEALRDLSVLLDNVGRIDEALGELETARAAFGEALEIARRLATALPSHADVKGLPDLFERRLTEVGAVSQPDGTRPDTTAPPAR